MKEIDNFSNTISSPVTWNSLFSIFNAETRNRERSYYTQEEFDILKSERLIKNRNSKIDQIIK